MDRVKDRLPSPAMIVALIALLAATGGTATALDGSRGVKKDDLAKNSVTANAIGKNAVSRSEIKNKAVSSGEIKDGAVKGGEVDESSLGQVPSALSASNAGTVDGFSANALVRVAQAAVTSSALVGVSGDAASTSITAPTSGYLVIDASAAVSHEVGPDDRVNCLIELDGTDLLASNRFLTLGTTAPDTDGICATNIAVQVAAGAHTVQFEFQSVDAGSGAGAATLSALFVPFGGTGTQP